MIHRFRVRNFKSLIDVDVRFDGVTVLVGKSGVGKSNLVEALRTLRDILSRNDHLGRLQQGWSGLLPAATPVALARFEVEFSITGIDDHFTYELEIAKQGPQSPPKEERLRLGDITLFHQADRNWVQEPAVIDAPKPGHLAIGRIPSISEIVVAYTALTSGIGCYVFPHNVLSGGPATQPTLGLSDDAVNYLEAIKDIASNLQDLRIRRSIVSALQTVNSTVSSIELNDIRSPDHVVVGHQVNGKTLALQLSQESDGFRRFYAHLLALYQRPPKQTLLFEHPEDGIHPAALELLAEEFKAAAEQGRGQTILTTHSPKLLDHFDVDQIRVVELVGLATRIGPVSKEQYDAIQDNLLDAGELLTTDPARLESTGAETVES